MQMEKKLEELSSIISKYNDFQDEQPEIYHFLRQRGHGNLFLYKFNYKIKPIE